MDFFGAKTPSCYAKMLLKIVFGKTIKFKISNNLKNIDETHQNNQKSIGKSIQPTGFKNLKEKFCKPKVWRLSNVCDFQKENHTLGCGQNNY